MIFIFNIPWGASRTPIVAKLPSKKVSPFKLKTKKEKEKQSKKQLKKNQKRQHINGGALRAPPNTWKRRFAPLPCIWFHLCCLFLFLFYCVLIVF